MEKQFNEKKRIDRAIQILKKEKLEALLINDLTNIRYLSGFTGDEASALIAPEASFLLVDCRFTTQAKLEAPLFQILKISKRIEDTIKLIDRLRVKRVGFDAKAISYADFRQLEKRLSGIALIPIEEGLCTLRIKKEKEEIKVIRQAITISTQGFQKMKEKIKFGVTEKEIAAAYELAAKEAGADKLAFDIIVASGKRSALPHGVASEKKIGIPELIMIDFGIQYQGYCSDETCTMVMGTPTQKQKEIFNIVKTAHDRAIEKIKPGISSQQIDKAARGYIEKKGFAKYFGHATGHGVGLSVHEEPRISPLKNETLEEGMVFTIEPGIYLPNWGGVRIEDLIVVSRGGCELLTLVPKKLEILH
ncbi:MAG TPA: aminopeptidase P family protein [Thermodesulfobacteriota bacterium]|nr:aminopeptidase P family protein [Thermodesulfobacteriota bacterium]